MIYNESNHLDARKMHNETLTQLRTRALGRVAINDPIALHDRRQRAIIEKALVSLASGDTQRTRELLGEL